MTILPAMPYIITTTTRQTEQDSAGHSFYVPAATRRAVATLEEARAAVRAFCEDNPHRRLWGDRDWHTFATIRTMLIPESGGTVGPLPDGTVIEVRPVGLDALATDAGLGAAWIGASQPNDQAAILDAYNAR